MRGCPVCRQTVTKTSRNNIAAHRDSLGADMCPATGHPMHITEPRKRKCKTAD